MEKQTSGVSPANQERARQSIARIVKRSLLLAGQAVTLWIALAISWPLTAAMMQLPARFYDFAFQDYLGLVLFLWTLPRLITFFIGGLCT